MIHYWFLSSFFPFFVMIKPFVDKKLVIFDMDGTLVNAVPVHNAAVLKEFKELLNVDIDPKTTYPCYGRPINFFMTCILDNNQLSHDDPLVDRLVKAHELNVPLFVEQAESLPNACEILEQLSSHGFELALATGVSRNVMEPIMKKVGLLSFFPVTSCGMDLVNGTPIKSRSELIRNALNLSLKRTQKVFEDKDILVVGDTISDIKAAQELGFDSLVVMNGMGKKRELKENHPTFICKTLEDISI